MSKYGLRLRSVHKNKNIPGYILNLVVLTAYSLAEIITAVKVLWYLPRRKLVLEKNECLRFILFGYLILATH